MLQREADSVLTEEERKSLYSISNKKAENAGLKNRLEAFFFSNTLDLREKLSHLAFYVALFIELTIVVVEKSEYIIQYEGLWFRLTFLLTCISVVLTRKSRREWIWFVLFSSLGAASYYFTARNELLRWIVFIWACVGKDMKKVFKLTFWYTLAGCIIIFLLSVTGIYGKMFLEAVYRVEEYGGPAYEEIRYCFGMGHPNAFHCMMLVITWLGIYCYYEKIKWYFYPVIGAFHLLVYYFTDSRTGLLMSAGSLFVIIVLRYWKGMQEKCLIYLLGMAVILASIAFSVYAAKYSILDPFLKKIDGYLTGRIWALYDSYNFEGMLSSWTLMGESDNYKYFDMGIVRFFYWFGVIPGIIYFLAQIRLLWCNYRNKDYMTLAMVIVITVYSVFEAHFISDYMGRNYILFFFGMYLSQMIGYRHNCHEPENSSQVCS